MKAVALKTDNRIDPMGIDRKNPILRWKCEGGIYQGAYRVTVWDEDAGNTQVYDSGWVETRESYCKYQGSTMSMHRYRWTVTLRDEKDRTEESDPAFFEMGLLSESDWKAHWICGMGTNVEERLPADYYKAHFSVAKKVVRARLYASALGCYFVKINGKRLPGALAPGFTDYHKRVYYQTYDIAKYLLDENEWEIVVGDGWYKGKIGRHNSEAFYGNQTMTIGQIVLTYEDGSMEILGTGDSFDWCNDGPIRYNDMKDGQVYDARMIPTYSMKAQIAKPDVMLLAQVGPMVTEHEAMVPKVESLGLGKVVLDFGQNFAGYIRFRLRANFGETVIFWMCETLDHGDYSNTTFAYEAQNLQKIEFIGSGVEEDYQPEFFYCGFRYAIVEGWRDLTPDAVRGIAVYSDIDYSTLFVRTSNKYINQWIYNARWTMKSNFVSVPTDSAAGSRSARTGDAFIFLPAAGYLADTAAFYDKWMEDISDAQDGKGCINNYCPPDTDQTGKQAVNGLVGWADVAVAICYRMWLLYGDPCFAERYKFTLTEWKRFVLACGEDKTIYNLPKNHPLQRKVLSCLLPKTPYNQYIVESGMQWGEWSDPEGEDALGENPTVMRPRQELNAAVTAASMEQLGYLMDELEDDDEADESYEISHGARRAYRLHYLTDTHHHREDKRQAPLVRALSLGLAEEAAERAIIARDLNHMVEEGHYRVGTGLYTTPYLLKALAEYGYDETAYQVLLNIASPGWLTQIEQGATTAWERFVGYDDDMHPLGRSMNHCASATGVLFAIEDIAGVRMMLPYTFYIAPIPGGGLEYCDLEYNSPYGMLKVHWEKTAEGYAYDFEIPSNTDAIIQLLDGQRYQVTAGSYHYSYDTTRKLY
ncbi:MAG: family 78 glycoside hydrolase catalytic domain [Lachnospiraceae bacterium]|nr:family 78 glycoside hydrolase catalytic domain [Lachnospiraceae bacterium]